MTPLFRRRVNGVAAGKKGGGKKRGGNERGGRSLPPCPPFPHLRVAGCSPPFHFSEPLKKFEPLLTISIAGAHLPIMRPGLVHTPVSHARAPLSAPCTPPGACGSIFVCAPLWQSWLPLLNPLGRGRPSRLSAWSQVNSPRHRHRPHAAMCTTSRNPPGPARNFALGSLVIPIHPPAHPHEACVPTLDIAPYPPPPTHPPAPPPGATADNPLPQPPPPPPPTFWQPPRP